MDIKRIWKKGWFSFVISALCFLYLLHFTWLKWGDLIVDAGKEMYVPLELSLGKLLYRDMDYLYGPFSPYFNAFLFKIFGVHIHTLILSGIITICIVSVLIYKIARIFLSIFYSTFIVLAFLFVLAFGYYVYYGNYNYILPHSYPAIHGIMFSLATLYFFYLSLLRGAARHKIFYSIFLTGTFLCRAEIGIMLTLAIVISLGIYFISQKCAFKKILLQVFSYLILPLSFAVLIYTIFFISIGSVEKSNLLNSWLTSIDTKNSFTNWLFGGSDIYGNTFKMLKTFLYYLFFCLFFVLGSFVMTYVSRCKTLYYRIFYYSLLGVIFLGLGSVLFRKLFTTYDMQFRSLPIICLLTIFISLWNFIKEKNRIEHLLIITISFFSLFLITRMLFHVWAGHYGYYILVPGMIIYYIFFLKITADILKFNLARRFFRINFLYIFILFIISHFNISSFCYKHRTLEIVSQRGKLYVFNNDRESRLKELIDFLRQNTNENETLVVFPEGITINFLVKRSSPLYYYNYMPGEIDRVGGINNIILDIKSKRIDYIVLNQRDATEFGYPVFGKDYGQEIMEYISENYILYKQFGPFPFTSEEYGIALFKRKST